MTEKIAIGFGTLCLLFFKHFCEARVSSVIRFERFNDIFPGNDFLNKHMFFYEKMKLKLEKISTGWDAERRLRRSQR